jgi:hypothetical protein
MTASRRKTLQNFPTSVLPLRNLQSGCAGLPLSGSKGHIGSSIFRMPTRLLHENCSDFICTILVALQTPISGDSKS